MRQVTNKLPKLQNLDGLDINTSLLKNNNELATNKLKENKKITIYGDNEFYEGKNEERDKEERYTATIEYNKKYTVANTGNILKSKSEGNRFVKNSEL